MREPRFGRSRTSIGSLAERLEQGGGAARVAKMHAAGEAGAARAGAAAARPGFALARARSPRGVRPVRRSGARRGSHHRHRSWSRGASVVVVANDATVKAGSWWPETIRKILRAQEVAMRQRIPIVYLVDSAGVNLPYQGGVFPGQYGAARIFYYNSIMRRYLHVPQISAVMGSCIAGGAYLPALSDVIFMVEGTSFMGLGGPNLVKGATGQTIDAETLGGARHPHRAERRGPLPGRERRRVPGAHPRVHRAAPEHEGVAIGCAPGSRRAAGRGPLRPPAAGPSAFLRHASRAGLSAGRRRAGRVPARCGARRCSAVTRTSRDGRSR